MSLKQYKKDYQYTYTFGTFPTIEALKQHPTSVKTVLFSPDAPGSDGYVEVMQLCKANNVLIDISPKAIQKLAYKENTVCIGVIEKYEMQLKPGKHVVLVNPSDMGNIGAVIRSMVAFGCFNLALIRPAVDFWDPKAIRASMGALFHVNIQYFESFGDYRSRFHENTLFPFMLTGASYLGEVNITPPFSLVFGNEGKGLPHEFSSMGVPIKIKQSSKVDSLNLAISVSIALYETSKLG